MSPLRRGASPPSADVTALGLAAVAVALALVPGAGSRLEYDRAAIAGGEAWRLLTGHWVHWSGEHLFWDLLAFGVLGVLCERRGRARFLGCLAGATLAVSLGLDGLLPGMAHYRGLSGLDSALFVLLAVRLWRERAGAAGAWWAAGALAAFLGKVGYESLTGAAVFVHAGVTAVPLAHLAGGAAGLVAALVGRPPLTVNRDR